MRLSQAIEDYLKAIYKLEEEGVDRSGGASTSSIARSMGVSNASVTNMLKRLAELGFVHYSQYKGVLLSERGRKVALEVIRHHRLLELYLHDIMGYAWDEVHAEAEYLEHHISEQFEESMAKMLGNPTHDPHGHPIPTRDGELPVEHHKRLSELEVGVVAVVRRVSDEDPELLRYVGKRGLKPRARLRIRNREPFKGPITLELLDEGDEQIVGHEVASRILVSTGHETE